MADGYIGSLGYEGLIILNNNINDKNDDDSDDDAEDDDDKKVDVVTAGAEVTYGKTEGKQTGPRHRNEKEGEEAGNLGKCSLFCDTDKINANLNFIPNLGPGHRVKAGNISVINELYRW